jgi:hypothetical protein
VKKVAAVPCVGGGVYAATGITRGKRLVVLVDQRKALAFALRNYKTEQPFSGLID